jgi:hypothetical protein
MDMQRPTTRCRGKVYPVRMEHGDGDQHLCMVRGVKARDVELPRDGEAAAGARQPDPDLEQLEVVHVLLHHRCSA